MATGAGDGNQAALLPAWSLGAGERERIALATEWPGGLTRDWALAGATGEGVRVCILDSGVEPDHPRVGALERSVVVEVEEGEPSVSDDEAGDLCGHGTACAGIVRSLAPQCALTSVRVLGEEATGSGAAMIAGLRWAVEEGYDVVNMSLSTTRREFAAVLHELSDSAYFQRTMLVASAHNMPVESYPWRFASVISVGSHADPDPLAWFYNPAPPVEFFARGVNVDVAWSGGGRLRCTGNSFATPHLSGICALVLSKHRQLTPFQLKNVLLLTASNVAA